MASDKHPQNKDDDEIVPETQVGTADVKGSSLCKLVSSPLVYLTWYLQKIASSISSNPHICSYIGLES